MQFSQDDIAAFAEWSGDRNPLHVDAAAARNTAFGQPVVHGMLTALRVLKQGNLTSLPRQLDIELRGAVFPDVVYDLDVAHAPGGMTAALRSDGATTLSIRADATPRVVVSPVMAWALAATEAGGPRSRRSGPAELDVESLSGKPEVLGVFSTAPPPAEYLADNLTSLHARVLALCSYVIGMELPGLRSLFTRVDLTFAADVQDFDELLYRARTLKFDRNFRMLAIELEVANAAGEPVAAAELNCYVRLTPIRTDPQALAAQIGHTADLQGKIALVCGGSRGLGAEVSAALAMAGCRVFASYARSAEAARALKAQVDAAGGTLELLEGDAQDATWCEQALAFIRARYGRLDYLVLNACAPPSVMRMGPEFARGFNRYVTDNLALAQVPLATCLPAIGASGGTVICISSSFVTEGPAGFGHYIALKEAVEATVRAAVRETPGAHALVARPPRLQTMWNDTPTGVLGTIPASDAAVHIVRRLVDPARSSPIDLLTDFPGLQAPRAAAQPPSAGTLVQVIASFTADSLLDGLRFWAKALNLDAEVTLAPYGQVMQALLSPASDRAGRPGMHVVMLRVRDWLRELGPDQASSIERIRDYLAATSADFVRAVRTHRAHASATTLIVLCPSAVERPGEEEKLLEATELDIRSGLSAIPGLTIVCARDLHDTYEVSDAAVADPFRDHLAHVPYQTAYMHVLSTIVMRHVHRSLSAPRKVVVVDCDNTLWRGVVGEIGADGVTFDAGQRALHQTLVRLSASGVLVALCSKNDEPDVWRVFDTRPDFALRREHVVAATVNWQAKSANLRALAERLNLGLDSFVFIDDNPIECAEVRAGCPEVLTIEWPEDADRAIRLLRHVWELDVRPSTDEDLHRTQLYKEEFRRQELQAETLTFADFLATLDLRVEIAPLVPEDLKRASQLTLRTNQFNFTTRRRDESAMQALVVAGTHEIRTVRVRDRFGDYGLVGLVIAEPRDAELFAETFLLSCRVLGRGVEHQMVGELGKIAASRGLSTVRLRVEPTKRNTPARAFLEAIAPAHERDENAGIVEAALPVSFATSIRFDPATQPASVPENDDVRRVSSTGDPSLVRARERLLLKTAFELATPEGLVQAIGGRAPAPPSPEQVQPLDSNFVFETFARSLGITVERVKELDNLEALGCDSFRIVEITVSLVEKFPWLPPTLLFEHRSVSEIAKQLADRSVTAAAPHAKVYVPRPGADDRAHRSDVAVVGMHLKCAGAGSPDELWNLLSDSRVAVTAVPQDRKHFLARLEDSRPHFAGLLEDIDRFDPELFGITLREAQLMDPQLRLFLEVAWNALQDAGCLGERLDPDTGVFTGVMYGDYAYRANVVAKEAENPFKCWEGFSLANRISQVFGFQGPSLAVDTACSSSATAIHLACRALIGGECTMAIAGGVNLILDPDRFVQLGRLGILSSSGRCLAFGADADGTVLGEGAGVVVLRPLDEALRRGDRIYGVIKGSGVSTGSGSVGFTAPNPQAQALAIRRALKASGLDPRTVSYVETHGTGTALGDPIEVRGLALAYGDPELRDANLSGDQVCSIGSVKPNIGHLEAGAGVLGLIKVLLQMQRETLLPSVTSQASNPQIAFGQTPFTVQRMLAPWTRPSMNDSGAHVDVPRRAGLNSFGVGGANVHLLLEESPQPQPSVASCERPVHVLTFSAGSVQGVEDRAADLARTAANDSSISVADLCFSANTAQRPLAHRAAILAHSREELIDSLRRVADGETCETIALGSVPRSAPAPKIAYLFTGQGSQYPGMGRELYDTQPAFKAALDRCAQLFDPLLESSLLACMFAPKGSPESIRLDQTGFTQPALFSLGYALSELWRSWGVTPSIVLGHSIGELTAMCVAGGLTLEDAATLVAARGRLMQALPSGGGMASVMTTEDRVIRALAGYEDRVSVAAINGPEQIVISGDAESLAEISARFREEGVRTKPLTVSHAFHSPAMRPMLAEYESVLEHARLVSPRATFVSSVHGRVVAAELLEREYWLRNVSDPVRFTDGMRAMDALGVGAFIEIGPQPILLALARLGPRPEKDARLWLPSIRNDGQPWPTLLSSLGRLFVAGADIDWRRFDEGFPRHRVSVPPHRFEGRRHWIPTVPAARASAVAEPDTRQSERRARTYEIQWRRRPLQGANRSPQGAGRWLIYGEPHGIGGALRQTLESRGGTCVVAAPSGVVPPDLAQLIDRCGEDLRGIVFVPARDLQRTDPAIGPPKACELVVTQAMELMQLIARPSQTHPLLWIVTQNAVTPALRGDSAIDAAHTALWGAGRTFALEHPELWGGVIDVWPSADAAAAAEAIATQLLDGDGEDQLALHGGERYVPRLVEMSAIAAGGVGISATRTYLLTGGLGALGRHVARWLVSRGARHLVLTGRNGLEGTGAREFVRELESSGAHVSVVSADMSHPDGVALGLAAVAPGAPLAGVFHLAGIDALKPLHSLAPTDLSDGMAAKAAGAWLLHERTKGLPLDFFVCFSSIAAVLGSRGRLVYAASNAFVDALASERQRLGLPALSVNWGPWAGGGMASDNALEEYGRAGNHGLAPAEAILILQGLLDARVTQATVADIEWAVFKPLYESRRPRPLLSEIDAPSMATDVTATGTGVDTPDWVTRLTAGAPETTIETLTELLREEMAQTVGLEGARSVATDARFSDLGMDSLLAADFAQRLEKRLGIRSTASVFEYPTVNLLAAHLHEKLAPVPALAVAGLGSDIVAPAPVAPALTAASVSGTTAVSYDWDVLTTHFTSENVPVAAAPAGTGRTDGYHPSVENDVFQFQKQAWPDRDPALIAPRWRWAFVESANRLGVPPRVWLHRRSNTIVGHNAAIPVRLKIGDQERSTAWLVDTMVLPAYRSQAVGARLMLEAQEDLPFALSLGQTQTMRAIQLRLGWHQVMPLATALLMIHPERVLEGKLPYPAAKAAGLAWRAKGAILNPWGRRKAADVNVREISRFGPSDDPVWEAMAAGVTCAVRRDASYLNWKYVDQPGQAFLRLEVTSDRGSRGIVVLMFRQPDDAYAYRRAFIVDLVAPLNDEQLLADMLGAAILAAEGSADALLCLHAGARLTSALQQAGYTLRKPSRYLLVRPGDLDERTRERLLDPGGWFVTQGDSDIDRP